MCVKSLEQALQTVGTNSCGFWELNLGPLEEQLVLLSAEPSLQLELSICLCLPSAGITGVSHRICPLDRFCKAKLDTHALFVYRHIKHVLDLSIGLWVSAAY